MVLYPDRCNESEGCDHIDHKRVNVSDEIETRTHVAGWFALTRDGNRVMRLNDLSDSIKDELENIVVSYERMQDPYTWLKSKDPLDFLRWALEDTITLPANKPWAELLVAEGSGSMLNPFTPNYPAMPTETRASSSEGWCETVKRCPKCGGTVEVSGNVKTCVDCGLEWRGSR